MSELSMADVIQKRRRRWEERHDIEYDKALTAAAARLILETPQLIAEVEEKPYLLIEAVFTIVDKAGKTVPFFLNEVQKDFIRRLEENGTDKPFFILKGRQQGFTSLITAMQLSYSIVKRNFSGFTVSHRADSTRTIFNDKAKAVYDRLPTELKPTEKYNNSYELSFSRLSSVWRVATASESIARGMTLNFVHFSEVAFYECSLSALQAGIGEAIVAGAFVVYESTANGFNQAKDLWDSGSCHNIFYEWWKSPEYSCCEYSYLNTSDAWLLERLRVLEEKGLSREQCAWYAKKYDSYIDKALIRQEYPCSATEAFVSSGYCVFDKEAISNRLVTLGEIEAGRRGEFVYKTVISPIKDAQGHVAGTEKRLCDIEFIERPDGYIVLQEELMTSSVGDEIIDAYPYALGGDTAGSGEDYYTAKVVNCITGRTAATLRRQHMDEDLYAEQLYCLGKHYNDALIGVETNFSRHPVRVLQELGYTRLYMKENVNGYADKREAVPGFETTTTTKPIIVQGLIQFMRENPDAESDAQTLREMLTFVRKEHGRYEAIEGCHDDLVMALAIAHHVKGQAGAAMIPVKRPQERFISRNFKTTHRSESFISWDEF